jgi:hypothetical protein
MVKIYRYFLESQGILHFSLALFVTVLYKRNHLRTKFQLDFTDEYTDEQIKILIFNFLTVKTSIILVHL